VRDMGGYTRYYKYRPSPYHDNGPSLCFAILLIDYWRWFNIQIHAFIKNEYFALPLLFGLTLCNSFPWILKNMRINLWGHCKVTRQKLSCLCVSILRGSIDPHSNPLQRHKDLRVKLQPLNISWIIVIEQAQRGCYDLSNTLFRYCCGILCEKKKKPIALKLTLLQFFVLSKCWLANEDLWNFKVWLLTNNLH